MSADVRLMRELAQAVDKDRGHDKSLLTRVIREAADEIEVLRAARKRIPRCSGRTQGGFRCAQGVGHFGTHSHPNDQESSS